MVFETLKSKFPEKLVALFRYIVEGLVVTFAGFYLTGRLDETHSIVQVSLTVSILLATIDALWSEQSSVLRKSLVAAIAWYFIYHPSFCRDSHSMQLQGVFQGL
jgi:hypothetical protein